MANWEAHHTPVSGNQVSLQNRSEFWKEIWPVCWDHWMIRMLELRSSFNPEAELETYPNWNALGSRDAVRWLRLIEKGHMGTQSYGANHPSLWLPEVRVSSGRRVRVFVFMDTVIWMMFLFNCVVGMNCWWWVNDGCWMLVWLFQLHGAFPTGEWNGRKNKPAFPGNQQLAELQHGAPHTLFSISFLS